MQPTVERVEALLDSARRGSGLTTIYSALDHLVALYGLQDAALVVDVPGFGHQVWNAGRRPLRSDEGRLRDAEPGLYFDPPILDPVLEQALGPLMLAITTLALRVDTRETLVEAPT
jgi:hypothetical protein